LYLTDKDEIAPALVWTSPATAQAPVRINVASQLQLLNDIARRFAQDQGFAVATLNLDHIVKLGKDDAFHHAYAQHTHVTADGRPVVWLSRLAGDDISLVTGSDLIDPVARLCAREARPIALIGSTPEVLQKASDALVERLPGLDIVCAISPPFGFDPSGPAAEETMDEVARSGAKLCLIALGAPKQEIFAARLFRAHPDIGVMSIGAGLDFIAGAQVRAPRLVRALAAEWLWRLARDPKRLGALYAACFAILPGLTLTALRQRVSPRKPAAPDARNTGQP